MEHHSCFLPQRIWKLIVVLGRDGERSPAGIVHLVNVHHNPSVLRAIRVDAEDILRATMLIRYRHLGEVETDVHGDMRLHIKTS